MYGAIIGDLAGSIYEYSQFKKTTNIVVSKPLIKSTSFFSDDTILTIAITDAFLHDQNYDFYLRLYIKEYQNYHPNYFPYFTSAFSPNLIKWAHTNELGNSKGNGALMRISPIGFLCENEREVRENARLATIPSHNSEEAISYATSLALLIFYCRQGYSFKEATEKIKLEYTYTPFTKFNTTCKRTLPNCLYALSQTTNFEEAISYTIRMGGDTDTNAAIVGSIAEALYGVPSDLQKEAEAKIPSTFTRVLTRASQQKL